MAACHILQTEVYSSQTVDDTLDISLAPTAATLEEDLNYIRSVIKAVHGGSTWYDVHESISDIVSDFAVEHYTTAEDAARAGQHKTIHADGLYAPEANITNSITLTAANYVINNEVLGPDNEPNGTRFWLSGPAWSAGAESGVIIGPVGTDDYFHKIRLKTNILEITGDTGAYATYILEDSTSEFFRVSSTDHTNQANVVLSDTLFSIKPYISNTAQDSPLEYIYSADFWRTTRFRSISSASATLTSTDHALEIGNISSGSGIRFGNNTILAVRTGNQPEQLKLNPAGTEAVSAWGDVSAAGAFPLRVGSENYGVWHQGNQGHNSGLDADTVDGKHALDLVGVTANIDIDTFSAHGWGSLISFDFEDLPDGVYTHSDVYKLIYYGENETSPQWLNLFVEVQFDKTNREVLSAQVLVTDSSEAGYKYSLSAADFVLTKEENIVNGNTTTTFHLKLYVESVPLKGTLFINQYINDDFSTKPIVQTAKIVPHNITATSDTLEVSNILAVGVQEDLYSSWLTGTEASATNDYTLRGILGSRLSGDRTLQYIIARTTTPQTVLVWYYPTNTLGSWGELALPDVAPKIFRGYRAVGGLYVDTSNDTTYLSVLSQTNESDSTVHRHIYTVANNSGIVTTAQQLISSSNIPVNYYSAVPTNKYFIGVNSLEVTASNTTIAMDAFIGYEASNNRIVARRTSVSQVSGVSLHGYVDIDDTDVFVTSGIVRTGGVLQTKTYYLILVPNTFPGGSTSVNTKIYKILSKNFGDLNLHTASLYYFPDSNNITGLRDVELVVTRATNVSNTNNESHITIYENGLENAPSLDIKIADDGSGTYAFSGFLVFPYFSDRFTSGILAYTDVYKDSRPYYGLFMLIYKDNGTWRYDYKLISTLPHRQFTITAEANSVFPRNLYSGREVISGTINEHYSVDDTYHLTTSILTAVPVFFNLNETVKINDKYNLGIFIYSTIPQELQITDSTAAPLTVEANSTDIGFFSTTNFGNNPTISSSEYSISPVPSSFFQPIRVQ